MPKPFQFTETLWKDDGRKPETPVQRTIHQQHQLAKMAESEFLTLRHSPAFLLAAITSPFDNLSVSVKIESLTGLFEACDETKIRRASDQMARPSDNHGEAFLQRQ
jgi:hypothetical protein